MPGTMDTLKTYAIGFAVGAGIYHFVLRPRYPELPALTVQKLIQENSVLRRSANMAMQKLASGQSIRTYGMLAPDSDMKRREKIFGFMENRNTLQAEPKSFGFLDGAYRHPEAKYNPERRQEEFGFKDGIITHIPRYDPNLPVMERQRRFGAMNRMGFTQNPAKTERERRYGFASATTAPLNPFGML